MASALSELCDAYADPESGERPCQKLVHDSECSNDGKLHVIDMIASILGGTIVAPASLVCPLPYRSYALVSSVSPCVHTRKPVTIELTLAPRLFLNTQMAPLCKGPCWQDISKIFTAVLQQWGQFDPSLAVDPVFAALQLTCVTPFVVGRLQVSIDESSAIQGVKNTLTVSMWSTTPLPHDTKITLRGINAKATEDGDPVLVQSNVGVASAAVTLVSWIPPKCSQHCPSSGLCPPAGCGEMCGADGRTPGHRCLQWCESDGILVVSLSSSLPANQMATFTFDVLNSAVKQAQKHISVTVWAPGVSVDIIVNQIPIAGILVAEAIPEFTFFQFDHLECACPWESDAMYDTSASMWRGGCPGMLNTVILKFGTNVPMHSNTQITLSGLVSLYGQNLETPSVRDALQGVSVVKWDPVSDEIILQVAPGTVKGGGHNAISLDVKMPNEKMPTQAGGVVATIRASVAGVGADLCLKDKVSETPLATATAILANCPRSFIMRSISQSTCKPLACNDITVTMAVSKLLSEETDLAIIMLMGFHPVMQLSANCQVSSASPSCGAVNSNDLVLSDGEVGSNHRNLFHDLKGVVGHAHWNASTMSVHMHLARDAKLEPFQPYVISFSLKNGPLPISGKIRITALDGDGLCAGVKTAGKCLGQEMVSTPAHFGVCVPQFTIASIAQQHQLPGCNGKLNNITVSLKTNVELTSPFNFTISGLHVSNVKYLSGFESDADVSIIESASVFTIFVSRQNFSAEILYDIVVSVLNTGDPVAFPRQQMTVSATAFGNSFSEILQQSTDMNVDPVGLVATIRQSTPYSSALNTLTFELTTNVALPVGAQITISGLMKTSSFGSSINLFNSSYSSGSESAMTCSTVLSRGAWNAVTGRLVINVTSRIEVLAPLSCSFHVINPSTANEPPIVRFSISCDGPCVNEGNNCRFSLGLTVATSGSTVSPFEGCLKCLEPCIGCGQPCDAADAGVLRVHAPGIILKHVRATTDSPMANNTIRLDLACNITSMPT